MVQTE